MSNFFDVPNLNSKDQPCPLHLSQIHHFLTPLNYPLRSVPSLGMKKWAYREWINYNDLYICEMKKYGYISAMIRIFFRNSTLSMSWKYIYFVWTFICSFSFGEMNVKVEEGSCHQIFKTFCSSLAPSVSGSWYFRV